MAGALLALLPCAPARAAVFENHSVRADLLPNGLHVIVAEEPEASVVALQVVVKAGEADERSSQSGAAHLLEHVLWAYGGPDDPRAAIEEIGGVTNAGTLRDFTHYYATVPAEAGAAGLAIDALARMVLREQFDGTVVTREQHVVEDEAAGRSDEFVSQLSELAFQTVYGHDHPYSRPLEGESEVRANLEGADAGGVPPHLVRPEQYGGGGGRERHAARGDGGGDEGVWGAAASAGAHARPPHAAPARVAA